MHIILIPAYEPHESLVSLLHDIQTFHHFPIIVVDDGSDTSYQPIFNAIQSNDVILIRHKKNMGKGAAIKTGITYIKEHYGKTEHILTCDADGQHLPKDIHSMLETIENYPQHVILGTRDAHMNKMPLRSKIGNQFSSFFFFLNTGKKCKDTQTGLRVIPSIVFDYALSIKDNRFDYEMAFLTGIAKSLIPMHSIPIETVYLDHNKASHFRPIRDSLLIYKQPLKFTTIALSSALIDLGLFTLLVFFFQGTVLEIVAYATIIARLTSGGYNFLLNRIWSFRSQSHIKKDALRYGILYVIQLLLSIMFVTLLSYLFTSLTLTKLLVDSLLFIISYYIQKHWVFKQKTLI
jgi:glycosyltransferase involved in cell wall biosynthesis